MDTITTSQAATKAGVKTATIRTWCRYGAITATKVGGRWNIDPASLTHRIALTAKPKPARPLTVEAMVQLGGSRWTKNGMDRVYLNNWAEFAGIEVQRYNTGNIMSCYVDGRKVANGRAAALLGAIEKVWFDAADGALHARHHGADQYEVRFFAGGREQIDLLSALFAGIKSAAAAL